MNSWSFRVDPVEFDLPLCVRTGQTFRWRELEPGRWQGRDGDHWYRVQWGETATVESNATPEEFERLFQLEQSRQEILEAIAAKVPVIREVAARVPGLRLMRPSCPVESAFSFLCSSNNHVARITRMVEHLATYGEPGECGPRFPSAEAIAQVSEFELRSCGFGYRGRTIPQVASLWNTEALRSLPDQKLRIELTRMPGIGPKLADCIALFAFHRGASVPVDVHVWRAAQQHLGHGWADMPFSTKRGEEVGDYLRRACGERAGWAQQFLFCEQLTRSR